MLDASAEFTVTRARTNGRRSYGPMPGGSLLTPTRTLRTRRPRKACERDGKQRRRKPGSQCGGPWRRYEEAYAKGLVGVIGDGGASASYRNLTVEEKQRFKVEGGQMKRAAAARAVLGLRPQIEKARITRRRACSQRGIVLSKMVKPMSFKHRVETYVRASTASQDLDVAEQLRVARRMEKDQARLRKTIVDQDNAVLAKWHNGTGAASLKASAVDSLDLSSACCALGSIATECCTYHAIPLGGPLQSVVSVHTNYSAVIPRSIAWLKEFAHVAQFGTDMDKYWKSQGEAIMDADCPRVLDDDIGEYEMTPCQKYGCVCRSPGRDKLQDYTRFIVAIKRAFPFVGNSRKTLLKPGYVVCRLRRIYNVNDSPTVDDYWWHLGSWSLSPFEGSVLAMSRADGRLDGIDGPNDHTVLLETVFRGDHRPMSRMDIDAIGAVRVREIPDAKWTVLFYTSEWSQAKVGNLLPKWHRVKLYAHPEQQWWPTPKATQTRCNAVDISATKPQRAMKALEDGSVPHDTSTTGALADESRDAIDDGLDDPDPKDCEHAHCHEDLATELFGDTVAAELDALFAADELSDDDGPSPPAATEPHPPPTTPEPVLPSLTSHFYKRLGLNGLGVEKARSAQSKCMLCKSLVGIPKGQYRVCVAHHLKRPHKFGHVECLHHLPRGQVDSSILFLEELAATSADDEEKLGVIRTCIDALRSRL